MSRPSPSSGAFGETSRPSGHHQRAMMARLPAAGCEPIERSPPRALCGNDEIVKPAGDALDHQAIAQAAVAARK